MEDMCIDGPTRIYYRYWWTGWVVPQRTAFRKGYKVYELFVGITSL